MMRLRGSKRSKLACLCLFLGSSGMLECVHAKEPPRAAATDLDALRQVIAEKAESAKTVGDFTELIQQIQRVGDGENRAVKDKYCRETLAWAMNRRGEIYLKHATDQLAAGNEEESKRLDRLAMADFDASANRDPQKWKAFHNRGTSYAVAGRRKEAIQDFSRVIELNPDYANAWHNRAEIHFDSGEYAKAIRDYTESLNRDSENRTALLKRGQSKLKLGKARAAIDDFDQLIKLDEQQASVYVERGEAKRALGEWEGAASDFRKAIQLDQKLAYAYQRAAWLMATCPEERIRNAPLAIQAARQAIELGEETDFRNHDVLAAALANDGKFAEAGAEVQRAMDAAPEEARENLKVRQELYQREMPYREKVQTLAAK